MAVVDDVVDVGDNGWQQRQQQSKCDEGDYGGNWVEGNDGQFNRRWSQRQRRRQLVVEKILVIRPKKRTCSRHGSLITRSRWRKSMSWWVWGWEPPSPCRCCQFSSTRYERQSQSRWWGGRGSRQRWQWGSYTHDGCAIWWWAQQPKEAPAMRHCVALFERDNTVVHEQGGGGQWLSPCIKTNGHRGCQSWHFFQNPLQTSILLHNGEPVWQWQPLMSTLDVAPPMVELLDGWYTF